MNNTYRDNLDKKKGFVNNEELQWLPLLNCMFAKYLLYDLLSYQKWDRAVVISINGRMHVLKDIINLVKYVRLLLAIFKESRIEP